MTTIAEFKAAMEAAGTPLATMDTRELGRFAVDAIQEGRFIISYGLDDIAELLHERADAIGRAELPPTLHPYQ